MQKTGRNDPCPCGSKKKFKKCCQSKLLGNKFLAQKVEQTNLFSKVTGLANIFASAKPKVPAEGEPQKEIKVTTEGQSFKPVENSTQEVPQESSDENTENPQ